MTDLARLCAAGFAPLVHRPRFVFGLYLIQAAAAGLVMLLALGPYFAVIFFSEDATAMTVFSYVPFSSAVAMPILYYVGNSVAMLFLMVFVIYWCYGTQLSVNASTAADFWGAKNVGANYGILFTAWGVAGVIGPIIGAFAAMGQRNIKRLMAYSSIGNIGYALVGLAAGTPQGVSGLLFYMATYVPMTLGSFAVILAMRQKGQMVEEIADLSGLAKSQPWLAHIFAAILFSMAGIPPLVGFFGKWMVFAAAVDRLRVTSSLRRRRAPRKSPQKPNAGPQPFPGFPSVRGCSRVRSSPRSGRRHSRSCRATDRRGSSISSARSAASEANDAPRAAAPPSLPLLAISPAPGAVEYTCPMHRDVVQDHAGDCPKCGMELVPKAR